MPKNAGAFRRLDIHLREDCIVGVPQHPTSCSVATTNIADRVANSVQAAFADMAEGQGMAECGAVIPPAVGVISGVDPQNGARFRQPDLPRTDRAAPRAPDADAWHDDRAMSAMPAFAT